MSWIDTRFLTQIKNLFKYGGVLMERCWCGRPWVLLDEQKYWDGDYGYDKGPYGYCPKHGWLHRIDYGGIL